MGPAAAETAMDPRAREILTRSRFFRALSEKSLGKLTGMARVVEYSRGEVIAAQDDPCPGIFVVGEGGVRIYKIAPSGKEHVLHFVHPGMTFLEVAAIGGFDSPAFVEAIEETTCALLPRDLLKRELERDHGLCLQLMEGMAARVRHLLGLLEDVVLRDATGRVARHILQAAGEGDGPFPLRVLKKDLASHLNLTSETLSRTLRRLTASGLIEMTGQQRILILDRAALQDVSEGLPPSEFE
jgi:CRP/FNR family transcriptional regulator